MKRYPVAMAATAAALAGILTFRTTNPSHPLSSTLGVGPRGGGHSSSTSPSSSPTTAVTGGRPGSSTTPRSASATGVSEQYGYGVLSVKVTVKNSKITDVQLSNLQTAESYSQTLAQQVVPYLRRQVLAAQSSHINGISGATYTSEAYALSVQSALDRLHFT